MSSPGDDIFLILWTESNKIGGIASNSYKKVSVLLRMHLCVAKRIHIDHVRLDLEPAVLKVGFKKVRK